MKVEIAPAVLDQARAFRHLTALAWMFIDGRHKWVVSNLDAVRCSRWLAEEGHALRQGMLEHAEKAARRVDDSPQLRVLEVGAEIDQDGDCWALPADIAEAVLRQPLIVVVENAKCDGAFLRFVLLRVGKKQLERRLGAPVYERLRHQWRNPIGDDEWFSVRHGGGSTTATQIELAVEAEPVATRRLFVLVDSDRATHSDAPGPTAQAAQAICDRLRDKHPGLRLRLAILDKREVENYLPDDALRAYRRDAWKSWTQLAEDQKDFADLKVLFSKDLWRVMLRHEYQVHFHESALRKRGGRELDEIVEHMISLL